MNIKWTTPLLLFLLTMALASCMDSSDDSNAQHNREVQEIDNYLNSIGASGNVLYDNSTGIRFVFHQYGHDAPPKTEQTVKVNYVAGLFATHTPYSQGQINQKIDNISPIGLRYCIGSLLKGGSATVYIPSRQGYGANATTVDGTTIPPNSILVYSITLTDVTKTSSQLERFQSDTTAISTYIKNNSIENAVKHSSGLWYTIDVEGTGTRPTPYDVVDFEYKVKLLSSPGTIVQQNTLTDQFVFGLIDGFKIGLPLIETGTTATFYIPSYLGYGTSSSTGIPENSNLIFEIKLTAVKQ